MQHINTNDYWQILITASGWERSIAPHSTLELPESFTDNYKVIDCHFLALYDVTSFS